MARELIRANCIALAAIREMARLSAAKSARNSTLLRLRRGQPQPNKGASTGLDKPDCNNTEISNRIAYKSRIVVPYDYAPAQSVNVAWY